MTGPEHYAEAERLLASADETAPGGWQAVQYVVAAAQAHATLALAAATAYPAIVAYTGDELGAECRGWANVTAPAGVRS